MVSIQHDGGGDLVLYIAFLGMLAVVESDAENDICGWKWA